MFAFIHSVPNDEIIDTRELSNESGMSWALNRWLDAWCT